MFCHSSNNVQGEEIKDFWLHGIHTVRTGRWEINASLQIQNWNERYHMEDLEATGGGEGVM